MSKQDARNTAAGMVRDALERLVEWDRVQDLRHFDNTKDEATRLLDMAQDALSYFEQHYDFPQDKPLRNCDKYTTVKDAAIAFSKRRNNPHPCPDFTFSVWLYAACESEVTA